MSLLKPLKSNMMESKQMERGTDRMKKTVVFGLLVAMALLASTAMASESLEVTLKGDGTDIVKGGQHWHAPRACYVHIRIG